MILAKTTCLDGPVRKNIQEVGEKPLKGFSLLQQSGEEDTNYTIGCVGRRVEKLCIEGRVKKIEKNGKRESNRGQENVQKEQGQETGKYNVSLISPNTHYPAGSKLAKPQAWKRISK